MKLNYNNKFKEKNPLDTVKIIKDYFSNLGFTINILKLTETQSSTWYCGIQLQYNGRTILQQNGKGITKDFCLASAHGELYERFCAKYIFMKPFLMQKVINKHYQNYNYYFHPEEVMIDFEKAFTSLEAGKQCLDIFSSNLNNFKHYIDSLLNNIYIGVPYQKVDNPNEKIYFDPRLSLYLHGSSGLSCGNSFYEAFNQGMSEIYEHEVTRFYVYEKPHEHYYTLNLNNINNEQLQNIINKIQEKNYLYIFDLSYNYKLPVLMSVIINKITHAISINFGSFPVFEIALERILTELYQGFDSFDAEKLNGQFPWRTHTFENMQVARNTSETTNIFFEEELLLKMQQVENQSSIFLTGDFSNKDIYNYMLELNQKNNFNIYYCNHSKIPEMWVLELIDSTGPQRLVNLDEMKERLSKEQIQNILSLVQESYDIGYEYIQNHNFDLINFLSFNERRSTLNIYEHYVYCYLSFDWFSLSTIDVIPLIHFIELPNIFFNNKIKLLSSYDETIPHFYANPSIYQVLITYATLYRYATADYSLQELLNICNILHLNYNEQDIIQLNNENYWLEKILLADVKNIFTNEYNNYINALTNAY